MKDGNARYIHIYSAWSVCGLVGVLLRGRTDPIRTRVRTGGGWVCSLHYHPYVCFCMSLSLNYPDSHRYSALFLILTSCTVYAAS